MFRRIRHFGNVARWLALLAACAPLACRRDHEDVGSKASDSALIIFHEISAQAGFSHLHHAPVLDHKLDNIMSWVCSVGAAAATADFNRDGFLDLYVTDSRKGSLNFLYRNNGDGTFTDVARSAGVAQLNGDHGTSMDSIWGDYDNDGWVDLYVVRWGNDVLYRNNHDGTFTDVTLKLFQQRDGSPGTQWANGNAVIFFDHNLDGLLDIYVGNYFDEVDLWHLESTLIMHDDFENARNGGHNFLYQQQANGTFKEVATALGVDDPGWTLAVGSADINNDGYPDLYCADDFGPDQMFLGRRTGLFSNVSDQAIGPDTKKGMNVDFGDFNNDGWLDIYVTNITTGEYLQEGNMLWHNNGLNVEGKITFTDISLETATYNGGWGWGAKFFDYDNDGDLDILALNGFISAGEGNYWYDLASWTVTGEGSADARNWPTIGNRSFSGYESTRLWRNEGLYSFSERAKELGISSDHDGRGVVTFDFDNDGDLDVFIANQGQPASFYRNDISNENHWLVVALETDPTTGINRDGLGTRVTLMTEAGLQVRERDGGNGYCGQSDPRLHFGLGINDKVNLLEVRWPDGGLQYLENVPADQFITVRQDKQAYAAKLAIALGPPKPWVRLDDADAPFIPEMDPDELEGMLTELEQHLESNPKGYQFASIYRRRCARYGQHDRAIRFFKRLVDRSPDSVRVRIDLACAYVDKIPTCGGLAAIVSKGTLAKKSLNQLDVVIAENPDLWVAYYCRGMNHLHWPRALLHSDDAVKDLQRCVSIQEKDQAASSKPYYLYTHVLLGDAWVKAKRYDDARKAWRVGLRSFPDAPALTKRLAINKNTDLLKFVENKRNLEQPIDTGLAFLDKSP